MYIFGEAALASTTVASTQVSRAPLARIVLHRPIADGLVGEGTRCKADFSERRHGHVGLEGVSLAPGVTSDAALVAEDSWPGGGCVVVQQWSEEAPVAYSVFAVALYRCCAHG